MHRRAGAEGRESGLASPHQSRPNHGVQATASSLRFASASNRA
jgi:hypothetical protein